MPKEMPSDPSLLTLGTSCFAEDRLRAIFASYDPEEGLPNDMPSFPILELVPDAPSFLAKAGHFSARDMKFIVSHANLDADPKNPLAVYTELMQRAEKDPATFPALERSVAKNRLQSKPGHAQLKLDAEKLSRFVAKFPTDKLRLRTNQSLMDRLGEFVEPGPVATDLWVGAFFEYSVHCLSNPPHEEYINFVEILFFGKGSEKDLADELFAIRDRADWANVEIVIMKSLDYLLEKGASNQLDPSRLSILLKTILAAYEVAPSAGFLRMIGRITQKTADLMDIPPAADPRCFTEALDTLGLEVSSETIDDAAFACLDDPRLRGLAFKLRHYQEEALEMRERQGLVEAQIAEATANKHYGALRALAEEAEIISEGLEAGEQLKKQMQALMELALLGEIESFETEIASFPYPESKDEELAIVQGGVRKASRPSAETPEGPVREAEETAADAATASVDETSPLPGADEEIATSPAEEPAESDNLAGEPKPDMDTKAETLPADLASLEAESPSEDVEDREIAEPGDDTLAEDDPEPMADAKPATEETQTDAAEVEPKSASTPDAADADREPTAPAIDPACLKDLIAKDLLGIAANAAAALETNGSRWLISHTALKVAAASRFPHRNYGQEAHSFLNMATRALQPHNDISAVLTLGALLRPAIVVSNQTLRASLVDLARGPLGAHLMRVAEAVSQLDYDFPPSPDKLAEISGTRLVPQKKRILERLLAWRDITAGKKSRWPFANQFMHHVVSDAGLIGHAIRDIQAGSKHAASRAQRAIDELGDTSMIQDRSIEYAADVGKPTAGIHPKGLEYLDKQFDEARALLGAWISADEQEGSNDQRNNEKLRKTIGNLRTRLGSARDMLDGISGADDLDAAAAGWLRDQVDLALEALSGRDTGKFTTLQDALGAEHDLLPAQLHSRLEDPKTRLDTWRHILEDSQVQEPEAAFAAALASGAFETAQRLNSRYDIGDTTELKSRAREFAHHWLAQIETRDRRLKTLAKVDYAHQQELARRLDWCETARDDLLGLESGDKIADLPEIPEGVEEIDRISEKIEQAIRDDQVERIQEYRTEANADDADNLLDEIDDIPLEAAEDRIAQLRDGRSAATMEAEIDGLVAAFTPDFVTAASGPDWPRTTEGYKFAFTREGPLKTEEDRRAPAAALLELFHEVCKSAKSSNAPSTKLKALFEDLGFEDARVSNVTSLGRPKAWTMRLNGKVVSDGWFLPPSFGSNATSYRLLLISPDTLPEAIQKALDPEAPTIILVAGIIDMARRHEFAERLRGQAIPALLIDEALIAFAATRRETRARTIFECGLPYGRVEPYTTDPGQIPPEMFFGRETEMRDILSRTADGCLVYGGRQLGKSALLSHIARTHHSLEDNRIIVRRDVKSLGNSEKTSAIWSHLNGMLSDYGVVRKESRTADDICRDIRGWLVKNPEGRIICLFDETDYFMASETKADYPELGRLKELMEDTGRRFKVVFAGLHNVKRMHRQPNSPLAHLGQPICIGPLNRTQDDKRAAYDLVVEPMRSAGFRFESLQAVEDILAWANYFPSLVQEYAKGLLSTLHGAGSGKGYRLAEDGPLWAIPTDDLFSHRNFQQIEARVREKFHLTLDLDPRYALVAYTLALLNLEGNELKARMIGFTPEELLDHASPFWPKSAEQPTQAAFDVLLDELFELGVIGKIPAPGSERARYCLRSRQVAAMLGSYDDIVRALEDLSKKDPAVSYDRSTYRRPCQAPGQGPKSKTPAYSPLTDLQIGTLFDDADTSSRIVCGLPILGLDRIAPALKRIHEEGQLPIDRKDRRIEFVATDDTKAFTAAISKSKPANGLRVVFHTPASAEEARSVLSWLEKGQSPVLDGHLRPVILLDARDPEMRGLAWRRRDQAVFLRPWASEMVRVHLHAIEETPLDTPEDRRRILAATGGIPSRTVELIDAIRQSDDRDGLFARWESSIDPRSDISSDDLADVIAAIEDAQEEDYEALDEILQGEFGKDLVTLAPDLVATALLSLWSPEQRIIRKSALGLLVEGTGT